VRRVSAPISTSGDADRREWLELYRLVEEEADTLLPIDLVRMDEAPETLCKQIRAEGRVLFER
jgi:hypothetical protein